MDIRVSSPDNSPANLVGQVTRNRGNSGVNTPSTYGFGTTKGVVCIQLYLRMGNRTTLRLTTEREKLLERVKEANGVTKNSKAIDVALKKALAFDDLTDQLRGDLREQAKQYSTDDYRINIRTEVTEK